MSYLDLQIYVIQENIPDIQKILIDLDCSKIRIPILHYSLENKELFDLLMMYPFDLSIKNDKGYTVFYLALKYEKYHYIDKILSIYDFNSAETDFINFAHKYNKYSVELFIFKNYSISCNELFVVRLIIKYNLLNFLIWLFKTNKYVDQYILTQEHANYVVFLNNIDMAKWFFENNCLCDINMLKISSVSPEMKNLITNYAKKTDIL